MTLIIILLILNISIINGQLYNKGDNVVIFDPQSFARTFKSIPVENWFIEFYSSFCGHCINFAPIFKEFLKEGKYWNKVVRFGVVDCSKYHNLCNEQGVKYYPFFKVFLNNSFPGASSKGQHIQMFYSNLQTFFNWVITQIKKFIKPPQLLKDSAYVKTRERDYLLLSGPNLVNLERTILTFDGRLSYPLLYRSDYKMEDYSAILHKGSEGLAHRFKDIKMLHKWLSQYLLRKSDDFTNNTTTERNNTEYTVLHPTYDQDIYSSIYYSFNYEISDQELQKIDNVIILRKFVKKLYLYSDINKELTEGFKTLMELLQIQINKQETGSNFVMSWPEMLQYSKLPQIKPTWIGCNGSLPHFRRFPCGLWTLFHTLTVNYHLKVTSRNIIDDDFLDLIQSIREFIFIFFKCIECVRNFKKETLDYESYVTNSNKAVLYLWKVHNNVNKRLSKASSEDPYFPKIAFPPFSECHSCRCQSNVKWPKLKQWSYTDVSKFIIQHYSYRVPLKQSNVITV